MFGGGLEPAEDVRLAISTCSHRDIATAIPSKAGADFRQSRGRNLNETGSLEMQSLSSIELDPLRRRPTDAPSSVAAWRWLAVEMPLVWSPTAEALPLVGMFLEGLQGLRGLSINRVDTEPIKASREWVHPVVQSWLGAVASIYPTCIDSRVVGSSPQLQMARGALAVMVEHTLAGSFLHACLSMCHERWLAMTAERGAMIGDETCSVHGAAIHSSLWEPSMQSVLTPTCDLPIRHSPRTDATNLARAHSASRLFPVATIGDWVLVAWSHSDELAGRVRVMEQSGGPRREAVMQQVIQSSLADPDESPTLAAPATTLLQGGRVSFGNSFAHLLSRSPKSLGEQSHGERILADHLVAAVCPSNEHSEMLSARRRIGAASEHVRGESGMPGDAFGEVDHVESASRSRSFPVEFVRMGWVR